jgi:S-DNA-T family DNA segregation ATPase FtsK/SpoIIIE
MTTGNKSRKSKKINRNTISKSRKSTNRHSRSRKSSTYTWAAEFQNRLLGTTITTLGILRKYTDELVSIILLSTGLLGILAVLDVSSGRWTIGVADVLATWLGWGALLVPLALLWAGCLCVARSIGLITSVSWLRIISGELAVLCLLGCVHIWVAADVSQKMNSNLTDVLQGGGIVVQALDGRGGGKIGWFVAIIAVELVGDSAAFVLGILGLPAVAVTLGFRWQDLLGGLVSLQTKLGESSGLKMQKQSSDLSVRNQSDSARSLSSGDGKLYDDHRFTITPKKESRPVKSSNRSESLPALEILATGESLQPSDEEVNRNAKIIEHTLYEFGVPAEVVDFRVGPAVTQFAVQPGFNEKTSKDGTVTKQKVRIAQISRRASDLTLALSAKSIRIEAPVPGQSYVGIEVPNSHKTFVNLKGVIESHAFNNLQSPLAIALGRDVSGEPVAADLGTMPHILIAGTTGSGKSVCITSIVTCLICNNSPDELRLVMVDPKKVELIRFNGLPHLLGRVEVELDRILGTLRWMTREMDRRYRKMEKIGARDLDDYNVRIKRRRAEKPLPRIVVVVDELADLMMMAQHETEQTLVRLAQMARATGIHLVVATQRPSTDIITGVIKANFPTRIAFAVASATDSRVIIDSNGAESLLGQGDMLFLESTAAGAVRIQGVMTTDEEVDSVVKHWSKFASPDIGKGKLSNDDEDEVRLQIQAKVAPWDELIKQQKKVAGKDDQIIHAITIVKKHRTASASLLQRKLKIGYPRAARLMDELYEMGVVGEPRQGGKTREVLIKSEDEVPKIVDSSGS